MVTVSYAQYAYTDTAGGGSYQVAYVLHPATFWNDFGPIHLTVLAPKGVACKASVPLRLTGEATTRDSAFGDKLFVPDQATFAAYKATLTEGKDKSGELFVGMDKAGWDRLDPAAPAARAKAVSGAEKTATK